MTFLPPQSRESLATVFQAVDLVAVPSYSESFGLVALEAQACGTPVAAAAVGGLPVAVRHGLTGTLVAGHDADRWARAIDETLRLDPEHVGPRGGRACGGLLLGQHRRFAAGQLPTRDRRFHPPPCGARSHLDAARGPGRSMAVAAQGVGMTPHDDDRPITQVQQLIEDTLDTNELSYSRHNGAHGGLPGIIVELPGERRLKTNTILSIGEHSVRVEAFVCRKPDENHEGVYRFLLKRNRRLYGVAYTLDNVGDIYLVGRMALASVDGVEIDRVLGQVLEAVDSDFNTLLELGFRSSIQKEWEWRVSRGESLKNLEAFAHLIDDDEDDD